MHFQNSNIMTSFDLNNCTIQVPSKDIQPGGKGRPALPFQLFVQGYDAKSTSLSDKFSQLILGFETEEEMEIRKSEILPHIIECKV